MSYPEPELDVTAQYMPLAVYSELGGTDSSGSFGVVGISSPSPHDILLNVAITLFS